MSVACLYDAHNHLQDERLKPHLPGLWPAVQSVAKMVVNGTCESDWPRVLQLAREHPQIIPSFGIHPWYVKERTSDWKKTLVGCLDQTPSAVGEIGLDRWIKDHDLAQQEEVFIWQLRLAAERNIPVSIHCLQAWGRLLEILMSEPKPACGFLLHSFGGSAELVGPLTKLGAYFSISGYFAHEQKPRQRESFRRVPLDRLLIETDAPDQILPAERIRYPLKDASGKPVNHPGNLAAIYEFTSELLGVPLETLAARVEENFHDFFLRDAGRGGVV
jgi:TatD DNase family protein